MFLQINFESEMPIYLQLRKLIIESIAEGGISPGEGLPTVRQMAADVGINLHTVNKTYSILKDEGYIVIHKRKGVLVNSRDSMKDGAFSETLEENIRLHIAEAVCKGISREEFFKICDGIYNKMKGDEKNE